MVSTIIYVYSPTRAIRSLLYGLGERFGVSQHFLWVVREAHDSYLVVLA